MTLKHTFQSAIADGGDATLVQPSNWNADHTISGNSLTLQYNNAGSLSEMSGTSWDNTNRALTLTGATVTASNPIFNLTQTWNGVAVQFTALNLSITNTNSASTSLLFNAQVGGVTQFNINRGGSIYSASGALTSGTGTVSIAAGSVAASTPILDLSQTWNNAAVAFTALRLSVTNTASTTGSLLMDLEVGGNSVFSVNRVGVISLLDSFGNVTNFGPNLSGGGGGITIANPTNPDIFLATGTGGISLRSDASFHFSSTTSALGAGDAFIFRDAAGILAQRNLANAQTFRVYNTTDAGTTNFERVNIGWSSNVFTCGVDVAGTGVARAMRFGNVALPNILLDPADTSVTLSPGTAGWVPIRDTGGNFWGDWSPNSLNKYHGTTAQQLTVYNTRTDAANYERGVFDWTTTANTLTIGTQAAGTGTARNVDITSAGGIVKVSGSNQLSVWCANGIGLSPSGNAGPLLSAIAGGVLGIGDSGTNDGFIQWGGEKRVTADFTVTSSTVLTNVTGLSVSVKAGRTYTFETELYVTDAAAGGVQAAIAGTATATAIQYTGYTIADNAIKGKTNATALATAVGSTTTTETAGIIVRITGTITVNVAGTLTVQMAQNTSNATATTAKRGSYFIVHDMP